MIRVSASPRKSGISSMQRLVLSTEQTQKLASFSGEVDVIDSYGCKIGELTVDDLAGTETKTLSPEELDSLRRQVKEKETAGKGATYTAQQVRD
jgi:hypothetical protein